MNESLDMGKSCMSAAVSQAPSNEAIVPPPAPSFSFLTCVSTDLQDLYS